MSSLKRRDLIDSFQDAGNRSSERFDKERRLDNNSRSKVDFSPPNSISTEQTLPSIRSNKESLLIQRNSVWDTEFTILFRAGISNSPIQNMESVGLQNPQLCRRSAHPTLEQRKIARINFDNNKNFGSIWVDNSSRKMRNRTKTTSQLLKMCLGLEKDVHKDDSPKKTGTTLLIKEIYQPNIETNSDQDKIYSIDNTQVEFSKNPSKRNFLLLKTN
ncbi:MAG: hypothetical protein EZS28_006377 [Streblomastix strix]|uniref:Uncharacterized protein n=1 Tax=Streblomastix strix TaxID=222440 RepID=A0A5J4WT35_9EUKA|nr:MAG: hypothetical protein EZS28_006377 [Streblomastix strix]